MKTITSFIFGLAFLATITGCKKDDNDNLDGTYTGTFRVVYSSSTKTGPVTVQFNGSSFMSSSNPDRIPAGGSGIYTRTAGKITFKDQNFWTADFDGNLILNGEYDYTFDGTTFKCYADKNGVGYYEYTLTRQ